MISVGDSGGRGFVEIERDGIDVVLHVLYEALRDKGEYNRGSRGNTRELLAVSLRLRNPRARISRSGDRGKPFSAIGGLLWYLSGSDRLEFIQPYIERYKQDAEKDGTLHGAYCPRLLNVRGEINQLDSIISERTPPGLRGRLRTIANGAVAPADPIQAIPNLDMRPSPIPPATAPTSIA